MGLVYPNVDYPDIKLVDCPMCRQGVRVEHHGGRLSVNCYGGCDPDGVLSHLRVRGQVDQIIAELNGEADRRLERASGALEAPAPSWPSPMHEMAFTGLAGDIVREIEPHSEAAVEAILVQFLVAVGNALGRDPGWHIEATRHYTNLFAAIVGDTSSGRKGTSWGQAKRLVEIADPEWGERVSTGLSSGEGLIWLVRDPIETRRKAKKDETSQADEHGFLSEITDLGAEDKRAMIIESELASVLERMGREGNTLSAVLRQAWDGERLDTLVKSSQAKATDAHVSVIGHITSAELQRKLTQTEMFNGFGNRFLWVCARRSRLLPFGGDIGSVDWTPHVDRLTAAIRYGRTTGIVEFDAAARAIWAQVYEHLSTGAPGMLGAITGRATAQVRRLAVVYSLLDPNPDGVPVVTAQHLRAALAVWDYSERSAAYLFGNATGDPVADTIVAELERAGLTGRTRNELRDVFGRHRRAQEMDRALTMLIGTGKIVETTEKTGGRSATRYTSAESAESAKSLDLDGLTAHTALTAHPDDVLLDEVERLAAKFPELVPGSIEEAA